jgi:hypothetical protein
MRTLWADLPAPVRAAVTAHTGPVTTAYDIAYGYNCQAAAILATPGGRVFVKGVAGRSSGHDQEAATAPHTAGVGPELHWRAEADGWDLIAFTAIDGRHADLGPGSPDLLAVAELLAAASVLDAPGLTLPAWADQWAAVAAPEERALLTGGQLVHGDINPHNLLVNSRAWLVDWAMPSRGPGWADTAEAAVRLMEDGHTAVDACRWADAVPAWRAADPDAVAMWCEVRCRALTAAVGEHGARHSNARHRALAGEVRAAVRR